jgi:hypothetical protein
LIASGAACPAAVIYQPGQTIRWKVQVKGADVSEAAFTLKKGGLKEVTKGKVPLSKGVEQIEAKLDEPGWLLAEVSIKLIKDKKVTALGGALDQAAGPLKDYPAIGNDDRETSYFLRMCLSCCRAAQYLTERGDWDGHTLVVTGGSQGGLQSIVTAGLHPKISAVLACVPAGCDLNGPLAGRMPGWPMWYWKTQGKDEVKVRKAAGYYDVVNFASRVKCPVLIGVGLIDTTCPSPGVYTAYNQLQGPKEIVVLPFGEHGEKKGSHGLYYARFGVWSQALVKGIPAPVK